LPLIAVELLLQLYANNIFGVVLGTKNIPAKEVIMAIVQIGYSYALEYEG